MKNIFVITILIHATLLHHRTSYLDSLLKNESRYEDLWRGKKTQVEVVMTNTRYVPQSPSLM